MSQYERFDVSCRNDDGFNRVPVDVLINEDGQRKREGGKRPRIRPPVPEPAHSQEEESEPEEDNSSRGVTVLDITNGYEPV